MRFFPQPLADYSTLPTPHLTPFITISKVTPLEIEGVIRSTCNGLRPVMARLCSRPLMPLFPSFSLFYLILLIFLIILHSFLSFLVMLSLRDQCFSFFTIFVYRVSNIRYPIWLSICVYTAYSTYESDPGGRAERPYKAALPTTFQIVLSLPFFTRNTIRTTNLLPLQCCVESHTTSPWKAPGGLDQLPLGFLR